METEFQVQSQSSNSKVQEKGMPATCRDISYLIIVLLIGAVAYTQYLYEKSTEELLTSTIRASAVVENNKTTQKEMRMEYKCSSCGKTYVVERAPTEDMEQQCFDCWYDSLMDESQARKIQIKCKT